MTLPRDSPVPKDVFEWILKERKDKSTTIENIAKRIGRGVTSVKKMIHAAKMVLHMRWLMADVLVWTTSRTKC